MESIIKWIEGLEGLIYRILLWFIFIPKTLVQVTLNPDWAAGYIEKELKQKDPPPFDEFMSPVVLLLTVALIPAVLLQFLPNYQVVIVKPGQDDSAAQVNTIESFFRQNNSLSKVPGDAFEATANFASSSANMDYVFYWSVDKVQYDANGYDSGYQTIAQQSHSEIDGTDTIERVDNNTARDRFVYRFTEPGGYYVNVEVQKIDPVNNLPVENFYDYIYVLVPDVNNPDFKGLVSETRNKRPASLGKTEILSALTNQLKSEGTIFLALAMLLPPLLFAFASRFVTRKEITEKSLKEIFYEECYYFAPLSLAGWASVYAVRFFTYDIFYYSELAILSVALPVLLAIVWFMAVQVRTIVREGEVQDGEQKIRTISVPKAFLIVVVCLTLIVAAVVVINFLQDAQWQDFLRKDAIRLYIFGSVGLLAWYLWTWNKKRRSENRKLSIANIVMLTAFALIVLCVLLIFLIPVNPLDSSAAVPQTSADTPAPQPTATLISTPTLPAVLIETPTAEAAAVNSNSFYVEEFDGNLDSWTPVTFGNESLVKKSVQDGRLVVSLSSGGGEVPDTYLFNNNFTYTDVQLEVVATNMGNNSNAVVLVCRSTDSGWYEFDLSNSGTYDIYAVNQDGYNELTSGNSKSIKAGLSTNTYTAVCKGSELSLYINGDFVDSITDTNFNFATGSIGIGVSSLEGLPVDVAIDTLKVSQP